LQDSESQAQEPTMVQLPPEWSNPQAAESISALVVGTPSEQPKQLKLLALIVKNKCLKLNIQIQGYSRQSLCCVP